MNVTVQQDHTTDVIRPDSRHRLCDPNRISVTARADQPISSIRPADAARKTDSTGQIGTDGLRIAAPGGAD